MRIDPVGRALAQGKFRAPRHLDADRIEKPQRARRHGGEHAPVFPGILQPDDQHAAWLVEQCPQTLPVQAVSRGRLAQPRPDLHLPVALLMIKRTERLNLRYSS